MGLATSAQVKSVLKENESELLHASEDSGVKAQVKKNTKALNKLVDTVQTAISVLEKQKERGGNRKEDYEEQIEKQEEIIRSLMVLILNLNAEHKDQESRLQELEKKMEQQMGKRINEVVEHVSDNKKVRLLLNRGMQSAMQSTPEGATASTPTKSKFQGALHKVINKNREDSLSAALTDSGYSEDSVDSKIIVQQLMTSSIQSKVIKAWQEAVKSGKEKIA